MAWGFEFTVQDFGHLEDQGDLVSRFMTPTVHIVTLVIPVLAHLLSPPDPPSRVWGLELGVQNGLKFEIQGLCPNELGFNTLRLKT